MTASRQTSVVFATCLLLATAAATASPGNREPRLHGPGGDGGACTEATDASPAPEVPAATPTKPAATTTAKPAAPARIKPVVTVRGGSSDDAGSVHAPRWHSFLPGMFR